MILHADVLKWLRGNQWQAQNGYLPRFHCVFADPPYSLSFMSSAWDTHTSPQAYQAWVTEWASLLIDFVHPGAVLAMFGGTRTYHRLTAGLEDAGWEIFDECAAYLYGSGFPKSAALDKLIDKAGGVQMGWFGTWLREWRIERGITQKEIAALFPSKTGGLTGCVANWELGLNMPTPEQFNAICQKYELPFSYLDDLEREIVGRSNNKIHFSNLGQAGYKDEWDITIPRTDAARQWEGYGTALKPSRENIVLARAPRAGRTYAALAQQFGSGALNIDGCRIGTEERINPGGSLGRNGIYGGMERNDSFTTALGRFPANTLFVCACEGRHEADCPVAVLDTSVVADNGLSMYNIDKQGVQPCCVNASSAVANSTLARLMLSADTEGSVAANADVLPTGNQARNSLGDTKQKTAGGTENGARQVAENSTANSNTDGYGNSKSGQSPTATKSITKTSITQTMTCPTCNSSLLLTMTICMDGLGKTTELNQTEQKPVAANDAVNINHSINIPSEKQGHIQATVSLVPETRSVNGERVTANTSTPICVNTTSDEKSNSPSRFFYAAKSSHWEREAGLADFDEHQSRTTYDKSVRDQHGGDSGHPRSNTHPTVKPIQLCEYIARLLLPPKLDVPRRLLVPFSGVASEMIGATLAGWDEIVGVEMTAEYIPIAEARLAWWAQFQTYEQAEMAYRPPKVAPLDDYGDLPLFMFAVRADPLASDG